MIIKYKNKHLTSTFSKALKRLRCILLLLSLNKFYVTPTIFFIAAWTCRWKETPYNGDVVYGGFIWWGYRKYLERHPLQCNSGEGINYFHFKRNVRDSSQYNIRYKCCSVQLPCVNKYVQNEYSCSNSFINSLQITEKVFIKLIHIGDGGFVAADVYNCCKTSTQPICYDQTTGYSLNDRHTVQCRSKYLLSNVRLQSRFSTLEWRYTFTCCKSQY